MHGSCASSRRSSSRTSRRCGRAIAVLTNLEPDHLDRHGTFEAYAAAKLRAFERQAPGRRRGRPPRLRRAPRQRRDGWSSRPTTRCRPSRGSAAPTTARTPPPRPPPPARSGFPTTRSPRRSETFPGVEHRIEEVGTVGGVLYVNDSKATNAAAALRALASFPGRRKHVILGGRGKAEPYDGARGGVRARRPRVPHRRGGRRARGGARRAGVAVRRCPARSGGPWRRRRRAASRGRRRPALPGLRLVRPVHELRAPRGGVPPPRGEAPGVGNRRRADRGQLEQRLLILVTLGLVAFGLVMVFSATSASAALGAGDPMRFLVKQGLYAVAGLVLLAVAHARRLPRVCGPLAPLLLVVAFVGCVAVLAVAPPINGAHRWFVVRPGQRPAGRDREARRSASGRARCSRGARRRATLGRADEAGRARRRRSSAG